MKGKVLLMPTMIKNSAGNHPAAPIWKSEPEKNPSAVPVRKSGPEREDSVAPTFPVAKPEVEDLSVVTRADWVQGPKQGEWTYETYAAIPEDGQRYEVIEGVLYRMSAPTWDHQGVIMKLAYYFEGFVMDTNLGEARVAPVDVELHPGTVVQPDAVFLLREHLDRITEQQKPSGGTIRVRVVGSPDLVVEIASPSTAKYDRNEKLNSYARAGVPEYWIINPQKEEIEVLLLEKGSYHCLGSFSGEEQLPSRILPNFPAKAEKLFPKRLASVKDQHPNSSGDPEPTVISDQIADSQQES
jgi:Uma2 family endonuclease